MQLAVLLQVTDSLDCVCVCDLLSAPNLESSKGAIVTVQH